MSNPIFFLHEKLFAFARCNAAGDAPKPEVSLQEVRSILYIQYIRPGISRIFGGGLELESTLGVRTINPLVTRRSILTG